MKNGGVGNLLEQVAGRIGILVIKSRSSHDIHELGSRSGERDPDSFSSNNMKTEESESSWDKFPDRLASSFLEVGQVTEICGDIINATLPWHHRVAFVEGTNI